MWTSMIFYNGLLRYLREMQIASLTPARREEDREYWATDSDPGLGQRVQNQEDIQKVISTRISIRLFKAEFQAGAKSRVRRAWKMTGMNRHLKTHLIQELSRTSQWNKINRSVNLLQIMRRAPPAHRKAWSTKGEAEWLIHRKSGEVRHRNYNKAKLK